MRESEKVLKDRFLLLHSLGRGGMAEVYLAKDLLLNREVAVKILHSHLMRQSSVLDHLRLEVAVTRRIRHPGVIQIYELFEFPDEDLVFLVMEFLGGGDLKTLILDQGGLPVSEAIRIGAEVLDILSTAHRNGVIHQDIKPHNLLFHTDGSIRVVDFGLARCSALQGNSIGAKISGTPEYSAPEMIDGRYVDSRADLYSLGITLYEAVTGRLPFVSNSPYATLRSQMKDQPPPLKQWDPDIPPGFEEVLLKALEKDPEERFQTAAEFADALKNLKVRRKSYSAEVRICPGCGIEMSMVFPWCQNCGFRPTQIHPARKGEDPYKVVVCGPGKIGEKIPQDKRHSCINLLQGGTVSVEKLEKKIPRLPFILIKGLKKKSADSLVYLLSRKKIEAIAIGRGYSRKRKEVSRRLKKKVLRMVPRILMIALGTGVGAMSGIMRTNPVIFPVVLGTLIIGMPLVVTYRYFQSETKLLDSGNTSLLAPLISLASKLSNPAFLSLTRKVTEKISLLEEKIAAGPLSGGVDRDPGKVLGGAVSNFAVLMGQAEEIDSVLRGDTDVFSQELIENTDRAFLDSRDIDEADRLFAEKRELLGDLENRRSLEQQQDKIMEQLLRFSSVLDSVLLDISSLETNRSTGVLTSMYRAVEVFSDTAEAEKELEWQ